MKKLLISLFTTLLLGNVNAQQWAGSTTTTGNIYRTGNVGLGISSPKFRLSMPGGDATISLGDNIFLNGHSTTGRISNNAYISSAGWNLADVSSKATTIELRDNGKIEMYGTRTSGELDWSMMFGINAPGNTVYFPNGNVGIGTLNPAFKLHVIDRVKLDGSGAGMWIESGNNDWFVGRSGTNGSNLRFWYNGDRVTFLPNGNVGIGCSNPQVKLAVNGIIKASEMRITTAPCSDFVFEPDYNLMGLSELEEFVTSKKHLPEVPSAAEFSENGYNVRDMDDILLRKVEELPLYIIKQQKELIKQQEEIEELKSKLK